MESTIWSLSIVALMLLILGLLTYLMIWMISNLTKNQEKSQLDSRIILEKVLESNQEIQAQILNTLKEATDKSLSLMSVKDPIAFQQIQAMNSASISVQEPVDNSDHAETVRWIEEQTELTPQEKAAFSEIPDF